MMCSRLRLAKNLLQDDGAIFINIDDNEIHNVRNLCNEIFGDENFLCQFSWRRTDNQSNIGNFARVKEYIVFYAKNRQLVQLGKLPLSEKAKAEYAYSDAKGKFRCRNILDKSRGKRRYEITAPDGTKLNGPWMVDLDEFNNLNEKDAIYWAGGKMPYGKNICTRQVDRSSVIGSTEILGQTKEEAKRLMFYSAQEFLIFQSPPNSSKLLLKY